MVDFHYPLFFLGYAVMALIAIYLRLNRQKRKEELGWWGGQSIRKRLFSRLSNRRSVMKKRLMIGGMVFLIFACTGPRIGTKLTEVERKGVDVITALDISQSMNAEDVRPNRLEKSKYEISRLIDRLKGDRIGIILFAGTSHLYFPHSTDYDAARLFLDAVSTDMISVQGTAIGDVVNMAESTLTKDDRKHQVLILISDGEDHEGKSLEAVESAVKSGFVIHTIGVGTPAGSLIPIFDNKGNRVDYKKDAKGKLVTTILNEGMLQELAVAGRGIYTRLDNQSKGIDRILSEIDSMDKKVLTTHEYSEFEDRFQIFTFFAFLFFVVEVFIPSRKKEEKVWKGRFV